MTGVGEFAVKSSLLQKLNQVLIVLYSPFAAIQRHILKKGKRHRLLIVFQANLGDLIMFLDSLPEYIEMYGSRQGYEIDFLCTNAVASLLMQTQFSDVECLHVVPFDLARMQNEFIYFHRIINSLNLTQYEIAIAPQPSLSTYIVMSYLNISRRIGLLPEQDPQTGIIISLFKKYAFTECLRVEALNTMEVVRFGDFVRWQGVTSFQSHIPHIAAVKNEQNFMQYGEYCVFAPGASKLGKMWPIDRFAHIADYIIEQYNLQVCVCGTKNEKVLGDQMQGLMRHSERMHNLAGETNISGWFGLIRQAKLCVSCDSASIHIATAVRTPSVCVAGRWHNLRFVPYSAECITNEDILPVCVYVDVDCYGCQSRRQNSRYADYKCTNAKQYGTSYACIEMITEGAVLKAVTSVMNRY